MRLRDMNLHAAQKANPFSESLTRFNRLARTFVAQGEC